MSDAAFREALDALIRASGDVSGMTFSEGSNVHHPAAQRLLAAEARVLALYAERQGEEGVVMARIPTDGWPEVVVRLRKDLEFNHGDRVRVSRCGEGV